MIYNVIQQLEKKAVHQACRVLQVSRSGYYAARQRLKPPVICPASVQVKAVFEAHQRCYGSRRIVDELTAQGIHIGRFKVRRLMREARLQPVWKKKFVNTTDSKHDLPVADNLLNRQFNPPMSNQAWTSDITYIRTGTGWSYLAAVMELHSRKIIGWAMDAKRRVKLSRVLGKRALKSFHPRLFNDRFFAGESWSDKNGCNCRNQTAAFC